MSEPNKALPELPEPLKQVAVSGNHGVELREPMEDYFDAPQMRASRAPVDDAQVTSALDALLPNGHRVWAYVACTNPDPNVTGREVMRAALEAALSTPEFTSVEGRALYELEELDAYLEGREDIDANGGPNVAMRVRQVLASALPSLRADGWLPRGDAVMLALRAATDWIEHAPHGDDCFVSDHYEGDPGNRCNCGKEGALQMIEDAHPPTAATPVGIVGERGDVSWRSEQILPVGTKLYAAATPDEAFVERLVTALYGCTPGNEHSRKVFAEFVRKAVAAATQPEQVREVDEAMQLARVIGHGSP